MTTAQALEQVRAKLEATFGRAMAMMVLASASNSMGVSTMGMTPAEFGRLARAVCDDQRVKDMWGAVTASETAEEWCGLVA